MQMLNLASPGSSRFQPVSLEKIFAFGALILILLGTKLMFIHFFGSSVPYWDQWDGEADILYKSYLNSTLSFSSLISSHNEHRILVTRLLALLLFELEGGWEPILQMVVNAGLHVIAISMLVLLIQQILQPKDFLRLAFFTVLVFMLPTGWENLLAGFQSQFYFLIIFSLFTLLGIATADGFSARWWVSVASAGAAYFSMASGALTLLAASGVIALQFMFGCRRGVREYGAAAALCILALVMIFYVRGVEGHDILKAHNISELLEAVSKCLVFPRTRLLSGLWINAPIVGYVCFVLIRRPQRTSPHWVVFGIILWLGVQILSLAYGRALVVTSSRYLDIIILGLPVNFGVLLFAWNEFESTISLRRFVSCAGAAWLFLVLTGLAWNAYTASVPMVFVRSAEGREQQANVLAYLRTGDLATLQNKAQLAIPYPSPERLATLLSDPTIRSVLPAAIRPADVNESAMLNKTFLKGRYRAWMTSLLEAFLNLAPLLLASGLTLIFLAAQCRTCQNRSANE